MSHLTRITILLAVFFGLDKVLAFIRQIIIARQFGLSLELDAFNVANNIPDLLFALISGGALAVAFIPVLSEVIVKEGHTASWDLFSRIANLAFIVMPDRQSGFYRDCNSCGPCCTRLQPFSQLGTWYCARI